MRRRLGRRLLLHARPLPDRRADERGRCSVCGHEGSFAFNSWILPRGLAEEWGDEFVRRESMFCRRCTSSLRVRRIADVLLSHYARWASTLAELVEEPGFRGLAVAEINSIGPAHAFLERLPLLRYSEYPEEDICRLSYGEGEFDLVVTSDTLEHVPDYRQALRETRRVLRAGGRHVFTVPMPARARTSSREGLPPQYHGRGSGPFALVAARSDLLAYTDFGLDIVEHLREAGFDPEVHGVGAELVLCAQAV